MPTRNESTTRKYDILNAVKLSITASSTPTTNPIGFDEVLLIATQGMWITWGVTPVAVVDGIGNIYLSAGEKFHLQCRPTDKIAGIQESLPGSLHIIPTSN